MHNLSVLIADDDAVIRMDLRTVCESLGYTVVGEADNGHDACILARNLRPSVAILDIRMPRLGGLEAAAVMGSERLCPVVLLTAYSDAPVVAQATEAGVLAYLVKPFRREDLQPAIEIATARYRELVAVESERDALIRQNEDRQVVARARAVLVRRHSLSDREALRRLQAQSLSSGRSLRQVADAVLLSDEIAGPDRPRPER